MRVLTQTDVSKSARIQQAARQRPAVNPVAGPPKRACACGGSCPSCSAGESFLAREISAPGGVYEREADRVADQVMRAGQTPSRRAMPDGDQPAQPSLAGRSGNPELGGGGEPLSDEQRAMFEPRLGADLSQVRIHTGSRAADLSRAVNAEAFTWGRHIVLGTDRPSRGHPRDNSLWRMSWRTSFSSRRLRYPGFAGRIRFRAAESDVPPHDHAQRSAHSEINFLCGGSEPFIRSPPSGSFHLNAGETSITVATNINWDRPADCGPGGSFFITLKRVRSFIWDSNEGENSFPVGSPGSNTWSGLDEDSDYYLEIRSANTNPNCCLTGSITVTTP